jgi:hypothetical protein
MPWTAVLFAGRNIEYSTSSRSHLFEKQPTPCSSDMNQESYARMSAGIEASEVLQEWRRQRLLAFQEPIKALLDSHLQAQNAAMAAHDTAMAEALG